MEAMNICKSCERHVYEDDRVCPFCGSEDLRLPAAGRIVGRHLSRTAAHAARAAMLVSVVACGSSHEPPRDGGEAMDSALAEAGVVDDAGASIDAAAHDAGTFTDAAASDAAVTDAGDRDAATDAGIDGDVDIPIYGGAFPDPRKRAVV